MSKQIQADQEDTTSIEQMVADYLHAHPDFFERHLDLVEELRVPHPSGVAASLIERQVTRLQEQNRQLKRKMLELVENARDNERINERMHGLALALMDSRGVDDVVITVDDVFRNDFHADAVALRVLAADGKRGEAGNTPLIGADDADFKPLRRFLRTRKPQCERLTPMELGYLFGDQAERINSTVMVPLMERSERGLLAIGSEDLERFREGMGTLYLERMGELVGRALQAHLD